MNIRLIELRRVLIEKHTVAQLVKNVSSESYFKW